MTAAVLFLDRGRQQSVEGVDGESMVYEWIHRSIASHRAYVHETAQAVMMYCSEELGSFP
jgi:hypothetical protein